MITARSLFKVVPVAAAVSALLAIGSAQARITTVTFDSTTPVQNGISFGTVGPYQLVRGTALGEIDPADRRNAVITDIQSAPKNARGMVEYKTQFSLHRPVDLTKASGVMVEVVPNRGGIAVPYNRNNDGLIYALGDIVLNVAWQGDQPIATQPATALGIDVPVATGVTGPVWDRFVAVAQTMGPPPANTTTQSLSGTGRTPATLDASNGMIVTATAETQAGVKSNRTVLPRADWAFADCRTVPFPGTPDPTRICIKGGFDPALLYEIVYTAKDPWVLGAGEAAMRDLTSWFRYETQDEQKVGADGVVEKAATPNPLAGIIKWVIGFGSSQSGRLQKHFLNNGFNEDEKGRIVMDGMNPQIAGMMGSFNIRFAQPGDIAELYDPGADGPIWWLPYTDTLRGNVTTGLLSRCMATSTCPKIFETYGGPEVWYSRGSVGMAGTNMTDLPLPANVRRFYHAGTTHGGGGGGFNLGMASTNPNNLVGNPNPQSDTNRALYVLGLRPWVMNNTMPQPSAYPKVSDGTLVMPTSAAMGWPNIPNTPKPDGVMNHVLDYDYGPGFNYNLGSGVISNVPPPVKRVVPTPGVKVDQDGNEVAGLKSLLMRMPLGTYTAWNPIPSGPLKGREASLAGGYIPFAQTRAQRMASGDPRKSIEERYGDLFTYYYLALWAVNDLISQRLLLPNDAVALINQLLNNILNNKILPKMDSVDEDAEE